MPPKTHAFIIYVNRYKKKMYLDIAATFAAVNNGNIGYNKDKNNEGIATIFATLNNRDIGYYKCKMIVVIAPSKGASNGFNIG